MSDYERGFEYGLHPEQHVHEDGCGHDGEGVTAEFLEGWRAGRGQRKDQPPQEQEAGW